MSKEEILAELPKLKEDFVYALQRLRPIADLIEKEAQPLLPQIEAKFAEVGRKVARVRCAHAGDHRTPVVYVQPEGKEIFGAVPEEAAVVEWLKKEITEKIGVAAEIEPGWGAPKTK